MEQLENKKLISITKEYNVYKLLIAVEKSYLKGWEEFYFALFQRHTGKYEVLKPLTKKARRKFFLFHLEVPIETNREFFTEIEALDLSLVRKRGEEERRSRIKSNYDLLEFLNLEMGEEYILYPSTTRQGNFSFYYRKKHLIAKLEKLKLSKEGIIHLEGIYDFRGLDETNIKELNLIVLSNLRNDEISIPVQKIRIPREYNKYSWYRRLKKNGFRAQVDFKPYLTLGKAQQYFKFYLQIKIEHNGQLQEIQSPRMKVNHLKQKYPVIMKQKIDNTKFKFICRPKKKSKYLSVQIYQYRLPTEIIHKARRKWVEIRRSKELLQLYKLAFLIMGKVLPVKQRLVVFESFHGKQFSDNPRAIYEYMKRNKKDYQLVWSVDRRHMDVFRGKDVDYVRRFSIRWLLLMARANYWVTNARLPLWIPKPKHTTYLQTWHGTPLKRLAADMEEVHMPGTNIEKYKKNFTKEASKWDYLISPNAYSTEIFRRAFQFQGEIIESGYPRNDYLYNANNPKAVERLKLELGIPVGKKVILYAPTWRDNQFYRKGKYKFDLQFDLDELQKAFGDTHVILLRMHYLVAENLDISAYKGFVYDFSGHEDIRDLYLISDVLITDYSSVFFDYANLRRPMIFFVYDLEDYRDNLRGFYFDFERKAPGPLVKTTEELIEEILRLEREGFTPTKVTEAFYEKFCSLEDGRASERVVNRVFP